MRKYDVRIVNGTISNYSMKRSILFFILVFALGFKKSKDNLNMTKNIFSGILLLLFLSSSVVHAAAKSNIGTGNWNTAANWSPAGVPIAGDDVTIIGGTTVTVSVAFAPVLHSVTVNGTLTTAFALTINNIAGSFFTINAGGTYNHNNTTNPNTSIFNSPVETFSPTSTINILKWNSTANPLITAVSGDFGNLILSYTGWIWNNNGLGQAGHVIQGNFTVATTFAGGTFLNNSNGNITINIGGNFIINNDGYIEIKRNCTGNVIFNVAGSTSISGVNSSFRGIYDNTGVSTGNFNYSTTNYSQSAGFFTGIDGTGGLASGSLSFIATGIFSMSGGQHEGVWNPWIGNWGIATYDLGSFNLTDGVVVFYSAGITDGRAINITIHNNCSINFGLASDFVEWCNISNVGNPIFNVNIGSSGTGNLIIGGNASAIFRTTVGGTGADNITIHGDLTIAGSTVGFGDNNTSTLSCLINGNITINGGTTAFSNLTASHLDLILGTAAVNWNQTVATASICNTNIFAGKIVSLTGTQMGNIIAGRTITVKNGSQLWCANTTVTGSGNFTLENGTTLGIGSIGGITSVGATGNVQVGGTRIYNSVATYNYYLGLTPQVTGNFVTTSTSGTYPCQISNLVINKNFPTDIVTLTNTTDITGGGGGVLVLTNGILTTSYTAATAPWVRISTGSLASPVGGSANSYVDGYIRKQGNTSFIFPTGNNGRWRRIEITAPSISTEFETRYVDAAYANTVTMAVAPLSVLDHVSLIEHWYLSKPLGADAATAKVKLFWEDASTSGILKFDSLAVGRWNGAAWEDANCYSSCPANWTTSQPERTYSGVANGVGAAGTIQSNTVSSFSPFTFASLGKFGPNPLPIELLSFQGYYDNFKNVLNWSTASETNNDYFTVERTFDGVNYVEVGRVNGAGNSTQQLSYSMNDAKQYTGVAYYRLKQTDFNGQFKYSSIISITHENSDHVNILPNPVSGISLTVNLSSGNDGPYYLNVYDIAGKNVLSQTFDGSKGANSFELNVSVLSEGMYFITIGDKDQLQKIKFIKE
ncbi:MAG: T9SS type A sorting domain-containing protein [Bacteroidetes bacterium]|nr:T9SS type A sorting domain-containing protein [Bacteroidota bacterium]